MSPGSGSQDSCKLVCDTNHGCCSRAIFKDCASPLVSLGREDNNVINSYEGGACKHLNIKVIHDETGKLEHLVILTGLSRKPPTALRLQPGCLTVSCGYDCCGVVHHNSCGSTVEGDADAMVAREHVQVLSHQSETHSLKSWERWYHFTETCAT